MAKNKVILIAQTVLYTLLFLGFNNKTFFLPIVAYIAFLFWFLEDWQLAVWLTLVTVLPFSWPLRSWTFSFFLPPFFVTPAGSNEVYYNINLSADLILFVILLLATVFKSRLKLSGTHDIWLVIFLLLSLLATSFSVNTGLAMTGFFWIFMAAGLYFLTKNYTHDRQQLMLLLQTLLVLILFEGLWASGQFLFQRPLGRLLEREIENFPLGIYTYESAAQFRSTGTLGHPNTLAIFLGVLLPLALSQLLTQNPIVKNGRLVMGATFFGLLGLIFTLSRWAWACFAVSIIFYLSLSKLKKKLFTVRNWLITVFALGLFTVFAFERIISTQELFSDRYSSLQSRSDLIYESWIMIKDSPWVGIGPAHFLLTLANNNITGVAYYFFYPVHNLYFLLAAELGLPAFIVLLVFIFKVIYGAFTSLQRKNNQSYKSLKIGVLVSLLYYLLVALGYTGTGNNLNLFFIILGLALI